MTAVELQNAFEDAVKTKLVSGKPPEEAVGEACRELGIRLAPEMEQNLINVLRFLQSDTPEFRQKRRTLTTRIRTLMMQGLSAAQAVQKAQETTGIKLGVQGEKALIDALEGERERMKDVTVDVVSVQEYQDLTRPKRCIFFHLNGKDGWACCQCSQHNRKKDDCCIMCSHPKCGGV